MNAKLAIVTATLFATTICEAKGNKLGERYVSFYGGWPITGSGTCEGTVTEYEFDHVDPWFGVPVYNISTYSTWGSYQYRSDDNFLIGARIGGWFVSNERSAWGFAGDISYFSMQSGPLKDVFPVSALMLYRFPLMISEDFPNGQLQPYIGVGFALVFADAWSHGTDAQAQGPGGSFHAGWTWKLNQSTGFFVEYRYLGARLWISEDETEFGAYDKTELDLETSLSVHQLLSGITYHF